MKVYTKHIYLTSASSISHQQDWCFTEYYRNVIHQDISIQNIIQQPSATLYALRKHCGWKCWRYSTAYMNWISMAQCVLFSIIREDFFFYIFLVAFVCFLSCRECCCLSTPSNLVCWHYANKVFNKGCFTSWRWYIQGTLSHQCYFKCFNIWASIAAIYFLWTLLCWFIFFKYKKPSKFLSISF